MTVQEAATALGVTVEAVRGRIHRGKYGREKAEDGRVYVVLTPDQLMNGRNRSALPEANVSAESTESAAAHPQDTETLLERGVVHQDGRRSDPFGGKTDNRRPRTA